ncbi:AtpZ/AtpI family protein [Gaetbulibacter aestuarii]|uniref:AtpZ/AtpI family protein n=1 Tax=Gaetbulibacter aestuarii TaxID=1502358 RepID=A0ABW7MV36_9FLAO
MGKNEKKNPNPKKPLKNFAILTGVGLQMGVTIYLFVQLGKWLDATYNDGGKLYLVIMTLLGVAISLYALVKQLNRFNN